MNNLHRTDDHDTSIAAAEAWTTERLTEKQAAVLEFFRAVGRATDEQLEDALSGPEWAPSSLRKRRKDLVDLGHLRNSGRTWMNRAGLPMIEWELDEGPRPEPPKIDERYWVACAGCGKRHKCSGPK